MQRWKKPREKGRAVQEEMNPQKTLQKMSFKGEETEGRIYRTREEKIVRGIREKQRWCWTWNSLHRRNT